MTTVTTSFADLAAIAAIGNAASDDISRPVICTIHLREQDGKLVAEASDSYLMAARTLDVEAPVDLSVTLDAKEVAEAHKVLSVRLRDAAQRRVAAVQWRFFKASASVQFKHTVGKKVKTIHAGSYGFSPAPLGYLFPNVKSLLNEYADLKPGDSSFQVNPKLIAKAVTTSDAVKRDRVYGVVVEPLTVGDDYKPIRLTSGADKAWMAYVMPVRPA